MTLLHVEKCLAETVADAAKLKLIAVNAFLCAMSTVVSENESNGRAWQCRKTRNSVDGHCQKLV
jgi:hypothetical protein